MMTVRRASQTSTAFLHEPTFHTTYYQSAGRGEQQKASTQGRTSDSLIAKMRMKNNIRRVSGHLASLYDHPLVSGM